MKRLTFLAVLVMAAATTISARNNAKANASVRQKVDSVVNTTVYSNATGKDSVVKSITVYSDTTGMDSAGIVIDSIPNYSYNGNGFRDDDFRGMKDIVNFFGGATSAIVIVSIILIFGIPLFIIVFIIWLIAKNRREKYKLAQEALRQGKDPSTVMPNSRYNMRQTASAGNGNDYNNYMWSRGIQETALGVGLTLLFLCIFGWGIFTGIGLLVTCIGVGKLVAVKTQRQNNTPDTSYRKPFTNENVAPRPAPPAPNAPDAPDVPDVSDAPDAPDSPDDTVPPTINKSLRDTVAQQMNLNDETPTQQA